jgi:hypothetical protein
MSIKEELKDISLITESDENRNPAYYIQFSDERYVINKKIYDLLIKMAVEIKNS